MERTLLVPPSIVPAKENPFGDVIYLKLPNEPSLRTVKFLDGAAERTYLLLTLSLRFAVEGSEVVLERSLLWGPNTRSPKKWMMPSRRWSCLTHTVDGWSGN